MSHPRFEPRFEVVATHDLVIPRPPLMAAEALLSPFVWRQDDELWMLIRAIPPGGGVTGRIWRGRSRDGLRFDLDETALIEPSLPRLDIQGCEDPTVVIHEGETYVFYTGVADGRGELLLASGRDVTSLTKRGIAYSSTRTELNTKEATVDLSSPGWWRLFFEFARDNKSCIGRANGRGPQGPWTEHADPIAARPGHFDSYHLSTGPLVDLGDGGDLVMFYNGSDAIPRWSIGWATFDRATLACTGRSDAPLIEPPVEKGEAVVFAASALVLPDGDIHLYFARDDDVPRRATIRPR